MIIAAIIITVSCIPVNALKSQEETVCYGQVNENNYSVDDQIVNLIDAVQKGKKNKTDTLLILLDLYNIYGKSSKLVSAISLLIDDCDVQESISSEQSEIISEILSTPSYNKTYILGNFEIRYNSNSNSLPVYINSLMNVLNSVDYDFVTNHSLSRPQSNVFTHRYHFYVTSDYLPYAAVTYNEITLGLRTSYSVIYDIQNSDLDSNLSTYEKGVVAHEYMHAINHKYLPALQIGNWFNEGWANWAALHTYGISTVNDSDVNGYLDRTFYSFISDNDNYGKVLLPLYIEQVYGIDYVIECVKKLGVSGDAITAIGNALPGTNTLQSIFTSFMRYNYAPKHFYTTNSSGWHDKPYISATYGSSTSSFTINYVTLDTYSARYYEFLVPSGGVYRYTITVNAGTSNIAGKLMLTDGTGYISNDNLGSGTYLSYTINVAGSVYNRGCIMIVNNDVLNATGNITISVSRTKIS